jgi:hypothetical protein
MAQCSECGEAAKLKACPCTRARYCSTGCQHKAWKNGHQAAHRHPDLDSFLAMDGSFYGHFGPGDYRLTDLHLPPQDAEADQAAAQAAAKAAGKMKRYLLRTLQKARHPDAQNAYWEMRTEDAAFDLHHQVQQKVVQFLLTSKEMQVSPEHTQLYLEFLVTDLDLEMAVKAYFLQHAITMAGAEAEGSTLLLLGRDQQRLAGFPTGAAAQRVKLPGVLQCAASAQDGIAQYRCESGQLQFQYVMCVPWTYPPRCLLHPEPLGVGPTACD